MQNAISSVKLNENLLLVEYRDGFWLYDKTKGLNISMRANTAIDALVEAICYYQNRLTTIENEYKETKFKIANFISQFTDK